MELIHVENKILFSILVEDIMLIFYAFKKLLLILILNLKSLKTNTVVYGATVQIVQVGL